MTKQVIKIADEAKDGRFYVHTYCTSWKKALEWVDAHNYYRIRVQSNGAILLQRRVAK